MIASAAVLFDNVQTKPAMSILTVMLVYMPYRIVVSPREDRALSAWHFLSTVALRFRSLQLAAGWLS